MKILVGWWDPKTGDLLTIPAFDHVSDPTGWLPAIVDLHPSVLSDVLDAMAKSL